MERNGILVIGSANMDLVVTTEHFPQPGETIFGKKFAMFPGGKGANQAVCCAKLGGNTLFIGKMGSDIFRDKLVSNMRDAGVILQHILLDAEESTGIGLITLDSSGQNQIVVVSGSNMKLTDTEVRTKQALFAKARVVLTQLEIPLATVLETAELSHEAGATFILNPAPAQALPTKLLRKVDYLIPNETELAILSGLPVADMNSIKIACQRLLEVGVKNVIVTLGAKGAFWVANEIAQLFPVNKVKVVDTTAAGDAFNGAFAFAVANGKKTDEAIQLANLVASLSVTRMGAQNSMPTMTEIINLRKSFNKSDSQC